MKAQALTVTTTVRAILAEIMRMDITVAITTMRLNQTAMTVKKITKMPAAEAAAVADLMTAKKPAVAAVVVAAVVVDATTSLTLRDQTSVREFVLTIRAHSMTAHSSILPMTEESLLSLSAAQAR